MKSNLDKWIFNRSKLICFILPIGILNLISSRIYQICVMLCLITVPLLVSAQSNCVLKKDQNNIKVYSCEIADSKLKAVRAEFKLNATINDYMAILLDVESYNEWHYRVINPRVLRKLSDTELIYYTQVSAPWPVSNRDLILRLKLDINSVTKVLTVTLTSIPDYLPPVKNVVRVPESYSKMTLTPIGNSRLKAEYFLQVDPGGQIPAWAVNLVSTQAPYETFKNLIERIERLQEHTTAASFIVN